MATFLVNSIDNPRLTLIVESIPEQSRVGVDFVFRISAHLVPLGIDVGFVSHEESIADVRGESREIVRIDRMSLWTHASARIA